VLILSFINLYILLLFTKHHFSKFLIMAYKKEIFRITMMDYYRLVGFLSE